MASKRMCPDTVTLYNYIGEVGGRATYIKTYLQNVKCIVYLGVGTSTQGRGESDTSMLYIFDDMLYAVNEDGEEVQYMPYEEWLKLEDKAGYWTLNFDGDDFYVKGERIDAIPKKTKKFRIVGFKRLDQGRPRMAHFEVNGE